MSRIRPRAGKGKQSQSSQPPAWHPFPEGWPDRWYLKFWRRLTKDPRANRLRTHFLSRLTKDDLCAVAVAAVTYAKDSKCFISERQTRLREPASDLRKLIRERTAEIPLSWRPADGEPFTIEGFYASPFARPLCLRKYDESKLETIKRLTNARRYGEFEDLGHLYYVREILERKSGGIARLKPKELAAIVAAAYHAIELEIPEDQNVSLEDAQSGKNLFRQLRRFAKDNAPLLEAIRCHIEASIIRSS